MSIKSSDYFFFDLHCNALFRAIHFGATVVALNGILFFEDSCAFSVKHRLAEKTWNRHLCVVYPSAQLIRLLTFALRIPSTHRMHTSWDVLARSVASHNREEVTIPNVLARSISRRIFSVINLTFCFGLYGEHMCWFANLSTKFSGFHYLLRTKDIIEWNLSLLHSPAP